MGLLEKLSWGRKDEEPKDPIELHKELEKCQKELDPITKRFAMGNETNSDFETRDKLQTKINELEDDLNHIGKSHKEAA
ncbi:MAG: hypothetical protein JWM20_273 [Patescibacteria group bacterium]|nr:hypothetical protein [Patescibacteria group bacterium]